MAVVPQFTRGREDLTIRLGSDVKDTKNSTGAERKWDSLSICVEILLVTVCTHVDRYIRMNMYIQIHIACIHILS